MAFRNIKPYIIISLLFIPLGCASVSSKAPRYVNLQDNVCQDNVTGVMWQKIKSEKISGIEQARGYANSQKLGGFNDWRLPTVFELYDLYYLHDLHVKSDCEMDLKGNFWSDEKDGEGIVGSWKIGDQCDPEREYSTATKGFVRLVRP